MSSPPRPGKGGAAAKGAPAVGGGSMESWVVSSSAAPPEVTRMFRMLSKPRNPLARDVFQPILADTVAFFITGKLDEAVWTEGAIKQSRGLPMSEARDIFTGCYKTVRVGTRARMTNEQLTEDLTDLKCPAGIIEDFQNACKQCLDAQAAGTNLGPRHSMRQSTAAAKRLVHLKWRVDVTMTTNAMLRVRKPTIMMEFHFDDGCITTTEVSPEKFQDLRYNVARMLKEIRQIERSRWVEDPTAQCN